MTSPSDILRDSSQITEQLLDEQGLSFGKWHIESYPIAGERILVVCDHRNGTGIGYKEDGTTGTISISDGQVYFREHFLPRPGGQSSLGPHEIVGTTRGCNR